MNLNTLPKYITYLRISLFLAGAFLLGASAGQTFPLSGIPEASGTDSSSAGTNALLASAIETSSDGTGWGLSFQEKGKRPIGNTSVEELKKYNASYAADTEEKVLYLTFDAGYENGTMPAILAALKKHSAPATFFMVGNVLKEHPDLIRQIVSEGHTIGNHTMTHPNMSKISSPESFHQELGCVEALYEDITGQKMEKFYRPPQGIYSTANLSMAKELGYHTFFWSLAYVDWYQDKQPSHQEAFDKLLSRVHPGAIVLLHSTSSTNGEILDELLTKWEEMGYSFRPLQELTK